MLLVVVLYAVPFLYLLVTSFKTPLETLAVPPTFLPTHWTIENFTTVWATHGVPASLINSVTTATISTLISLALAIPAAYAITRFHTRAGQYFVMLALVTRMVPPVAIGIPLTSTIAALHLIDTPTGLALAHTTISLPLSIWLMSSFFEAVPNELEEAAKVDGAGPGRMFVSIVLPMSKPILGVVSVFAVLAAWKDFLWPLLVLPDPVHQPLSVRLPALASYIELDVFLAALAISTAIPIVLFLVFQRMFLRGAGLSGAIKG